MNHAGGTPKRRPVWLAATAMAALAGAVLFACTVANGLHVPDPDRDATVPDAGDGCDHARTPVKPTAPDGNNGTTYMVAFEEISFGTKDAGATSLGLDLDGVCTCTNGAPPSCVPVAAPGAAKTDPSSYCDGPRGQDNALGVYSNSIQVTQPIPFSLAPFLNSRIAQGQGGLLLVISGYSGERDDANVSLYFLPSRGAYRLVDGGSGDASDGATEYIGRDAAGNEWSVDPDYVADKLGSKGQLLLGYVKDYTLVAQLSGELQFAGLAINFTEGTLIAPLIVQPDNTLRIDEGVIVGRWPIDGIATAVAQFSISIPPVKGPICTTFKDYYEAKFLPGLCGAADVRSKHEEDNHGLPCDALSVAMGFRALPAKRGDAVPFGGLEDCSEAGIPPLQCR